jgi:hypothetical protein
MANSKRKDSLIWGIILVVLGLLFLFDSIDLRFDIWRFLANLWPVILIAWGAWKLFWGIKEAGQDAETRAPAKARK